MSEPLYPVTIVKTRYGGIYEGGVWAAFLLRPDDLPGDAFGSDVTCATWWGESGTGVGVGATPDAALGDLEARHREGQRYRG